MELELHQLDLRYEGLRKRSPRRERQLMGSLSEVGQLLPIVVVRAEAAERYVVIDGYKRVRAARRLRWDTVVATIWEIGEADALLLERMMRTGDPEGPLEQGWLLCELRDRFGLSQGELARRFDRTVSWVSRRLALVADLPPAIQEHVRSGAIPPYAAMKYLVPLARANAGDCARLVTAIAPVRPTTRQVAELYAGWCAGSDATRERLLAEPGLYLRAREEARRAEPTPKSPLQQLLDDLGALGGVARRAFRRVQGGLLGRLLPAEREEVDRCFGRARSEAEAFSLRPIARALGVSRQSVREVLALGSAEVPALERAEKAEPYREQILELYAKCSGNLVLVHEGLVAQGAQISYPALTAFCRRHGIGYEPRKPAGRYVFEPGQEMQHDTSPHEVSIGGTRRRVQTASLVLAWSRMIFIQIYPRFTRFDCKVFLTDAFQYFGGTCKTCRIDNTHVVVLRGTGREMVPVPEMAAFAERYGFVFRAHEVGDANRSAQVETHFQYVEGNFLRGGRSFTDFADLNRQAVAWCDHVNAKPSRRLHGSRRELFAAEAPHLVPLPLWVPPVYRLHDRIVDVEGYVSVQGNRYSVPYPLIGRRLEVRETKDRIEVFQGPRQVASHARVVDAQDARVTLAEHRPPRGEGRSARHGRSVEEETILRIEPQLGPYVAALKAKVGGPAVLPLRRLRRLLRDYPREPFLSAVQTAAHYGLYDMERLERMILRRVGQQYFVLPGVDGPENDDETK